LSRLRMSSFVFRWIVFSTHFVCVVSFRHFIVSIHEGKLSTFLIIAYLASISRYVVLNETRPFSSFIILRHNLPPRLSQSVSKTTESCIEAIESQKSVSDNPLFTVMMQPVQPRNRKAKTSFFPSTMIGIFPFSSLRSSRILSIFSTEVSISIKKTSKVF